MATKKKLLEAAAGSAGGETLLVENVFSTYLYTGTGATRSITNEIDLSNEGGLVWIKGRGNAINHTLSDTERGVNKQLPSNTDGSQATSTARVTGFNSNGFDLGTNVLVNSSGLDYVAWSWRKAPKFFTCLTYTGTGSAQNISHDLGATVGTLIVKRIDSAGDWTVWHRGVNSGSGSSFLNLNLTSGYSNSASRWNSTAPTSTQFSVGTHASVNASGGTYIAYLFAHNNSDGEFGPDSDADIIKCGSYAGSDSAVTVNLGFEPQWIMIKNISSSVSNSNWIMIDNIRGHGSLYNSSPNSQTLKANSSDEEKTEGRVHFTPTGFYADAYGTSTNSNGNDYIYIAIRRPFGTIPESGTDVFAMDGEGGDGVVPTYDSPFPIDMVFRKEMNASGWGLWDRLRGGYRLQPHATNAEDGPFSYADDFDFMDGWAAHGAVGNSVQSWMFKRAPGFFTMVPYSGTGVNRTIAHDLGAVPKMMWIKRRDNAGDWQVYHAFSDLTAPEDYFLKLNTTDNPSANINRWNDTAPTESVFTLGTNYRVNGNNENYIAYLFGEVDGVSKFGSYTGNGTGQNIDCGFSSGARFVVTKSTSIGYDWTIWDTYRGIVAGTESYVTFQSAAQNTSKDIIDPYSGGFAVTGNDGLNNLSGERYIYWAIA